MRLASVLKTVIEDEIAEYLKQQGYSTNVAKRFSSDFYNQIEASVLENLTTADSRIFRELLVTKATIMGQQESKAVASIVIAAIRMAVAIA